MNVDWAAAIAAGERLYVALVANGIPYGLLRDQHGHPVERLNRETGGWDAVTPDHLRYFHEIGGITDGEPVTPEVARELEAALTTPAPA